MRSSSSLRRGLVAVGLLTVGLVIWLGAGERSAGPVSTGPLPKLPEPYAGWPPTLNFSKAEPWPEGAHPNAPPGFKVTRFAANLNHPRWLYMLPNGDILVAESSTLPKEPKSLNERIGFWLQRRAGVIKPSANRITLLREANGDGAVTFRGTFCAGLNQPFGMVLVGNTFYVADTDAVWRFPYHDGNLSIDGKGEKILDLPVGGYNNHWTRNIIVNPEQTTLYITVGSGSNDGEHGIDNEFHRANILEVNLDGSGLRVLVSGMRNPVGMAWAPGSEALWTVVNERDMMGNDLVPDYLTRVREGAFYGWPYSYWGKHLDPGVKDSFGQHIDPAMKSERPDLAATSVPPDYSLGAHVAPLGLTFYSADSFPSHYRGGVFVGEHGSWNRKPFSGYKVVFIPFRDGFPDGAPEDFLTGFMPRQKDSTAYGRPVGVIVDRTGALLIADDTGDMIWRVSVNQ